MYLENVDLDLDLDLIQLHLNVSPQIVSELDIDEVRKVER